MSRSISASIQSQLPGPLTEPGWLIHVKSSTALRYHTRGTISFDGYTWLGGATVSGIGDSLTPSMTLTLPNTDNAASALALGVDLRDVAVDIYAVYGASPTDADLLVSGVIDEVSSITATRVEFKMTSAIEAASSIPDVVIGPPLCNFIPAVGSVVSWRGFVFTLEDSNG
jgi:hypothetical protein